MGVEINYGKILEGVASRIERLKKDFPQLKDFSPAKHMDRARLRIDYEYHTHPSQLRGGWRSGVPDPDDDGIWFYLDFHDPDSQAQIHTQPVVPKMCLGNKKAFLLILQGKNTQSIGSTLWAILESYGVKPCEAGNGPALKEE